MSSPAALDVAAPPAGHALGRGLLLRPLRILASRRTAVMAMTLMAGILALASLVPAGASTTDSAGASARVGPWIARHLRPREIAASPFFLVLPGFLFLAIAVSVFQRVKLHLRHIRSGAFREMERFRSERDLVLPGNAARVEDELRGTLRRAHWRLGGAESGVVRARMGSAGFGGSILFHVGLLLLLLGVGVSARTRVSGEIVVTEGFAAPLERSSFVGLEGAERVGRLHGLSLGIRDFVAEFSRSATPVDLSVLLSVMRDGKRLGEEQVRVNQPLSWDGFQMTLNRYGFAPAVVAVDPGAGVRLDAVGVLRLLPPGRRDALPLDGGGELGVKLYPDFAMKDGEPGSRSPALRNPFLAFDWIDAGGRGVASGLVAAGGAATVGGYTVRFPAVSYWCSFLVTRDRGVWLLILGSLAAALGLALRIGYPDRTIRAECAPDPQGTRLRLCASTRFFPALHEEWLDRLVIRLQEGVRRG